MSRASLGPWAQRPGAQALGKTRPLSTCAARPLPPWALARRSRPLATSRHQSQRGRRCRHRAGFQLAFVGFVCVYAWGEPVAARSARGPGEGRHRYLGESSVPPGAAAAPAPGWMQPVSSRGWPLPPRGQLPTRAAPPLPCSRRTPCTVSSSVDSVLFFCSRAALLQVRLRFLGRRNGKRRPKKGNVGGITEHEQSYLSRCRPGRVPRFLGAYIVIASIPYLCVRV